MKLSKNTIKKICGLIVFADVLFFIGVNYQKVGSLLGLLWGILIPFIMGAVIAFIVNIPMNFIEKKFFQKWKGKGFVRPLSIVVTLVLVVLLITGVTAVIVPQIGTTTVQLVKSANAFFPKAKEWGENIFKYNPVIRQWIESLDIDTQQIISTVVDFVKNGAGSAFSSAFSAAKAVVSGITSFFIGLIFAIYLLFDKENLQRQSIMLIDAILPEKASKKVKYVSEICFDRFSSFISCQCLEACILGAMFLVVLLIARIPYALLISVLITFTALIPVVGAFIGCAVGAFLILMESPVKVLVFLIIFIILQQIEGNLIYPKVVGGSVGLPSIWVLFAVTVGSSLMGIAGMLFFIPLASVIYYLLREWTYQKLEDRAQKSNIIDEDISDEEK